MGMDLRRNVECIACPQLAVQPPLPCKNEMKRTPSWLKRGTSSLFRSSRIGTTSNSTQQTQPETRTTEEFSDDHAVSRDNVTSIQKRTVSVDDVDVSLQKNEGGGLAKTERPEPIHTSRRKSGKRWTINGESVFQRLNRLSRVSLRGGPMQGRSRPDPSAAAVAQLVPIINKGRLTPPNDKTACKRESKTSSKQAEAGLRQEKQDITQPDAWQCKGRANLYAGSEDLDEALCALELHAHHALPLRAGCMLPRKRGASDATSTRCKASSSLDPDMHDLIAMSAELALQRQAAESEKKTAGEQCSPLPSSPLPSSPPMRSSSASSQCKRTSSIVAPAPHADSKAKEGQVYLRDHEPSSSRLSYDSERECYRVRLECCES